MASLVVSWTRMLEEVQATAEERPLADFEHDEAHFLRARPAAVSGAPRAAARPPGALLLRASTSCSPRRLLVVPRYFCLCTLPAAPAALQGAAHGSLCTGRSWPAGGPPKRAACAAQELVKQKFDPEKFAGVFTRGGGGPPRWLDGLLQDWRGPALPAPGCWDAARDASKQRGASFSPQSPEPCALDCTRMVLGEASLRTRHGLTRCSLSLQCGAWGRRARAARLTARGGRAGRAGSWCTSSARRTAAACC